MLNREYKNQCDDSDLCWATVSTQYSSAPPSTNQEGRVSQIEKRVEEEQGPKTKVPTLLPSGLWEKLLVVDHHCIWIQLEPAGPAFETACCGHMIQFTQFNAWEEQASLDHALRKEHVCSPILHPYLLTEPDENWELSQTLTATMWQSCLGSSGPLLSGMFCDRGIFLSCLFKP